MPRKHLSKISSGVEPFGAGRQLLRDANGFTPLVIKSI